jgi:hypothetical protein
MYIINPRIMDIAITTPAATSIPSVRYPKKGLINSSGVKAGVASVVQVLLYGLDWKYNNCTVGIFLIN